MVLLTGVGNLWCSFLTVPGYPPHIEKNSDKNKGCRVWKKRGNNIKNPVNPIRNITVSVKYEINSLKLTTSLAVIKSVTKEAVKVRPYFVLV